MVWTFEVTKVMQSSVVEVLSKSTKFFIMIGKRLKHYHSIEVMGKYVIFALEVPSKG